VDKCGYKITDHADVQMDLKAIRKSVEQGKSVGASGYQKEFGYNQVS